jgi:hypothetical protein
MLLSPAAIKDYYCNRFRIGRLVSVHLLKNHLIMEDQKLWDPRIGLL